MSADTNEDAPDHPSEHPVEVPPADGHASRTRVVAIVGVVLAIAALIVLRVAGEDGPGIAGVASNVDSSTTAPPTSAASVAIPDTPTKATERQLGGISFVDVTKEAGLDAPQSNQVVLREKSMTSGAAVADVDDDGDQDIYLTRIGLPNSLYRNNGDGTFTDIAADTGVGGPSPDQGSGAAAFADINGDGCLDLFVAAALAGRDALYVNRCSGRFTNELAERGIDLAPSTVDLGAQQHGVTFDDIDHDGDLDLLNTHWDPAMIGGDAAQRAGLAGKLNGQQCDAIAAIRAEGADRTPLAGPNRSRMYLNDGRGNFSDATRSLGLPLEQIAAFTPQFVDIDADGWEDLLITGDFCTSRVFRNNAGTGFTDITEQARVATDENGMGSVVRDVNGDGRPDWFITSIRCATPFGNTGCSGNRMYVNAGNGTFDDRTDEYGLRHGWWGWGAAIEDFGDDGRLQFAQANGFVGEPKDPGIPFDTDPLRFWVPGKRPGDAFVDAAKQVGLSNTANGHAMVPFDFDGDGDLDLLVANFGGPPNLYRNDRPKDRAWLTVRLDDRTRPGNRSGIGAKVVIDRGNAAPNEQQASATGWITTGGSYESQKPAEFHIGLGDHHDSIPSVEVWWPGATEPQVIRDVAVDRVLTVTRG